MPTVLITGAGRGLGLEFVRQYAGDGWRVLAVVRDPAAAAELRELTAAAGGKISVHRGDVGDHASIDALAAELRDTPIDVLINNAGTMGRQTFATMGLMAQRFGYTDYQDWAEMFRINVQGPMKVAEAFFRNVAASAQKKIVTLTSVVGSIGSNTSGGLYAYRTTKAAANAMMRSMAIDLAKEGVICAPLHPGWARTAMGGAKATVDPKDSVAGLRQVIAALDQDSAGKFVRYDGTELPW